MQRQRKTGTKRGKKKDKKEKKVEKTFTKNILIYLVDVKSAEL